MADVTKINGYIIKDANAPHPSNAGSAGQVLKKTETGTEWADASFKPAGKSYLTFSSPNSFTLKVNDTTKHWNGTLEYFTADRIWTVWDGTTTLSAVADDGEYVLYLRGTGNTVITGDSSNYRWVLTGSDIAYIGNIENLLDYATVASGSHPTMTNYCYSYMFYGCRAITQAPELPATTLASGCYYSMFQGCTSLTQAPALPATTLANYCYYSMFQGCTSLTQAPALPATTLASSCYYSMFSYCASLTQAPALPATTLASSCYNNIFQGCTSLIQAPALPATTLVSSCYRSMFSYCASLTQAPALPATTLADYCYGNMFYGCTSLIQAPALPATTLANYCYVNMFYGCSGLKLSSTQTDEYTIKYRIPASGTSTSKTGALNDMFASTGGTFTGTPEINTTYYLSSDNIIVHETEVATLNEYVGSMIDAAIRSKIDVNMKGAANGVASLGADGKVPSAQLPEMGGKAYTVLLRSTGWAQSGSGYSQTVNVTGVTASSNGSLRIAQSATDEQFAAWGAAKPRVTAQAAGTLTVKAAGTVPALDIPVEVLIV